MNGQKTVKLGADLLGAAIRVLSTAAACCAAAAAAVFVLTAQVKISYPYQLNLGESALAQSIRYFMQGIWPYHELSSPPFSVVPYGPVYLTLSALTQNVLTAPMAGGRIVCFASSVIAALCIGRLILGCGRSRIAAVGSACFFLSLPFVERWGVQVNVDMTAVAIELIAAAAFAAYLASGHTKKIYFWVGTSAVVTAFFTKSSAVAVAAAWAAHLLFTRRWRELTLFVAVAGTAVVGIYAALNLSTQGQYYFHTTLEIGRRKVFWQFIPALWKETILRHPLNTAAAVMILARPSAWRKDPVGGFLNLYLAATVLMTVSVCKQGSDSNYLLPFMAASTVALGRLWGMNTAGWARGLVAGVSVVVAFQALVAGLVGFSITDYRKSMNEKKIFYDKISRAVQNYRDPIISWDMGLLIASDRPVYFEPFPMAQAAYSKVWDQEPILSELRSKKFPLIITYFWHGVVIADRNFTPEFIKEFKANYQLVGRVKIPWDAKATLFFYSPKKS